MTNKEAKEIIESECYVFNPLNLDRTTKINTALDVNSYIKLKKQFKEMILSYKVSGKFPHLYQEKPYLLNSNNNLVDINNLNPSSNNCTYESSSIRLYNSNYALSPQKNSNFASKFNILPKS